MYSSKFSAKDFKISEKTMIDVQLLRLNRLIQDIKVMLTDANDMQYASEMIIITDTLHRLENLQMYKLLLAKDLEKISEDTKRNESV